MVQVIGLRETEQSGVEVSMGAQGEEPIGFVLFRRLQQRREGERYLQAFELQGTEVVRNILICYQP